jgi:hypothetical protein
MHPILCCGRLVKARTQCQIFLASFLVLLLAILVPTLAIENNRASDRKANTVKTGQTSPFELPLDFSGIIAMANVSCSIVGERFGCR